MYQKSAPQQLKYELVLLENLVPQDHLLRKIDKGIDFSFIDEICRPYYCENNGRPAIEPEKLFEQCLLTAAAQNMKKIAMCCG